ncbi:ATPase [Salmonella enterica]|nr:ATPase [Salmonella enterica]ECI8012091.1 ATPase [Salmonella enterica subsp. enterica]HEC8150003.1 ATPase [Salmonella enterica subsp. enterica serovar Mississippi]EBM7135471.1 ATPase [Salmonella enterica]EJU7420289.1 ATPase [Salmonella enterica]
MSNKIKNPVVLIRKRENSDTYAVAITSGSKDYRDAVLMATMELDMAGDDIDTWSKTGYYMAADIERLKQALSSAESNLIDSECHVAELEEALRDKELQLNIKSGLIDDVTNGKALTITLPDITSKAFWSGTGKNEVFHPESYKRRVKEAIERACVIAGVGVEVK